MATDQSRVARCSIQVPPRPGRFGLICSKQRMIDQWSPASGHSTDRSSGSYTPGGAKYMNVQLIQ